ncbi:MAG: NUDIX domain-containing protein [Candidatus Marinimicrobia bacterium]|nr:NUDIX domain-containing protein [Candidatus Neomarinimicrobiota bacterium]
MNKNRPKVGIGVIIRKEGKILLGKRINAHGEGTWSFPGGHLEFGESWQECALREVKEETGLRIKNIRFFKATNDIFKKEQKHYITLFMECEYESGELQNLEPDKCEKWDWFDWNDLPGNLFLPIKNLKGKQ